MNKVNIQEILMQNGKETQYTLVEDDENIKVCNIYDCAKCRIL